MALMDIGGGRFYDPATGEITTAPPAAPTYLAAGQQYSTAGPLHQDILQHFAGAQNPNLVASAQNYQGVQPIIRNGFSFTPTFAGIDGGTDSQRGGGFTGIAAWDGKSPKFSQYDAQGNYLGDYDVSHHSLMETIAPLIPALFAGGAMLAAGGAGAGAGAAGGFAGGGAGAADAAAAAAAESAAAGGAGAGLGGAEIGAANALSDAAAYGGLSSSAWEGAGLGAAGAGAGAAGAVFNPAVDSQLASTQLGITGSQAAADAAAAGIPSVSISNLASTNPGLWDSLVQKLGASGAQDFLKSMGGPGGAASSLSGWASLLSPAMTAVGGYLQNQAAGNAADAQLQASNNGIAENRRQFDTVRGLLQPYVDAGNGALGAYQNLSGLKGNDAQQAELTALQGGPQFGSLVQQGENAILQNAAATGGLRGGNTQDALANYRTNVLSGLIDKQLGRYGSLINTGQASAAGVGNAALSTGQQVSALMQQGGAAQAGGIVAGSNAITNALGGIGGFFAGQNATASGPPPNPYATPYGAPYGAGVAPNYAQRAF